MRHAANRYTAAAILQAHEPSSSSSEDEGDAPSDDEDFGIDSDDDDRPKKKAQKGAATKKVRCGADIGCAGTCEARVFCEQGGSLQTHNPVIDTSCTGLGWRLENLMLSH